MIFFITLFRYFTIVLFFTLHFFSFSQGMQTRERAHCARSVFPFIKKKKKKKKTVAELRLVRTRWCFPTGGALYHTTWYSNGRLVDVSGLSICCYQCRYTSGVAHCSYHVR